MNRLKLIAFLFVVLAFVTTGFAQELGEAPERGKRGHQPPNPQEMYEKLGLNSEQITQMEALHAKYRPQLEALRNNSSDDRAANKEAMQALRTEQMAEVEAILTPEQFEEFQQMAQKRRKGRRGARPQNE